FPSPPKQANVRRAAEWVDVVVRMHGVFSVYSGPRCVILRVRHRHNLKNYIQLNLSLLYWILIAPFTGQFFKIAPIFRQMVFIGVRAAPMVALTAFSVGVTLAMQAAHSLQSLGAEMYIPDLVMLTL